MNKSLRNAKLFYLSKIICKIKIDALKNNAELRGISEGEEDQVARAANCTRKNDVNAERSKEGIRASVDGSIFLPRHTHKVTNFR